MGWGRQAAVELRGGGGGRGTGISVYNISGQNMFIHNLVGLICHNLEGLIGLYFYNSGIPIFPGLSPIL